MTPDHWVYLPEKTLTVHRISEFKNFSKDTCPEGKTLVCAEITCNIGDDRWNQPDKEVAQVAIDDLVKIGLFEADEVGDTIVNLKIGTRIRGNFSGSFYLGYGFPLTDDVWYDDVFRFEYRVSG